MNTLIEQTRVVLADGDTGSIPDADVNVAANGTESSPLAEGCGTGHQQTLNELAREWRHYWLQHREWEQARSTADLRLATGILQQALKNAADLGLSLRTFIEYDWEANHPITVNRVCWPLISDCFAKDEAQQAGRAYQTLVKKSGVRVNFSYDQNDAGLPDILYVIKENKYYTRREDGVWLPISKEHLKTMVCQHGVDTEGYPSGYDNYLLWLAQHQCVADISEVPMEADSDPAKCCTGQAIVTAPDDPGRVLLGTRFLTHGNALIISAPTGIGKSTLGVQGAVCFASGQPLLGIKPSGNLRVLFVQAENDALDMKDMLLGVCRDLKLTDNDSTGVLERIVFYNENTINGMDFLACLRRLCKEHTPDLIIIDPLNSYAGEDLKEQTTIARFCRNGLGTILRENQCGCIILHHTNKPKANDKMEGYDLAYNFAGSADLVNWARGMITIQAVNTELFKMTIAKRWHWAGMMDNYGRATARVAFLKHAKGYLCWQLASVDEIERAEVGGVADDDFLVRLPKDQPVSNEDLRSKLTRAGVTKNDLTHRIDSLVASGKLHYWKRPGRGGRKYYARIKQPPDYNWSDYDVHHQASEAGACGK